MSDLYKAAQQALEALKLVDEAMPFPVAKHAQAALRAALATQQAESHDWEYDGLNPHNGEYWYKCAKCGKSDWITSYGTINQLMPRKCEQAEPVSADVEWPAQTGKLPEGMEHCTLLFKQCERGHGQLTATNWVPQPCLVCEVQKLRALIGDDAYAASFQSLSQYRNALLRELKKRLTI